MILLKKPYKPTLLTGLSGEFNVYGKSFYKINAVYLSGSPVSNTTLYNPFSGAPKLSAHYPQFTAYKLLTSQYTSNNDNTINIRVPAMFRSGYVDIIVENLAGYGTLTQYVIKDLYSGTQELQDLRPWASGIEVLSGTGVVVPENQIYTIDGNFLVTIAGDNVVGL
jgi:hypothetical protein